MKLSVLLPELLPQYDFKNLTNELLELILSIPRRK